MNRPEQQEENELFEYLKKINKSVEPYSKVILGVFLVCLVAAIGYGLYRDTVSGNRSEATLELLRAVGKQDTEALAQLGETKYPGTPAAAWAHIYAGNAHLSNGIQQMFADRDDAQTDFDEAKSSFEAALAAGDNPILRSRAYFGLARIEESLGNIDEAVEQYEKCVGVNESKEMVEVAQERIETLSSAGSKEFLAWFMKEDFAPKAPSLPPSLPPMSSLPDIPDFESDDSDEPDDEKSDEPPAKPKDGGFELPPEGDEGGEEKDAEATDASDADTDTDTETAEAADTGTSETASDESADAGDEKAAEDE